MEDGAGVAFVDSSDGDGELEILHLVCTDVDGILEVAREEEECGCVLYKGLSVVLIYIGWM